MKHFSLLLPILMIVGSNAMRYIRDDSEIVATTVQENEVVEATTEKSNLPNLNLDIEMPELKMPEISMETMNEALTIGSFFKFLFFCGLISAVCVLLMNFKVCDKIPHCKKQAPQAEI